LPSQAVCEATHWNVLWPPPIAGRVWQQNWPWLQTRFACPGGHAIVVLTVMPASFVTPPEPLPLPPLLEPLPPELDELVASPVPPSSPPLVLDPPQATTSAKPTLSPKSTRADFMKADLPRDPEQGAR
jgi:hypothetical protein